jgi:hypothetical protein
MSLPSIPGAKAMPLKTAEVRLSKAQNLFRLDFEIRRLRALLFVNSPFKKYFIQFDCRVHVKMGIEQAHMDPRLEGRIETSNAVGSQK